MTPDSLTTFTVVLLWIRELPDSCYPPSDCAVTGPLTRELNKFRTQMVSARDAAKDVLLYDSEKLNPEAKEQIERGQIGRFVALEPGALAAGRDTGMVQVATATRSRDTYTANDYIERDREAVLGISANQSGSTTQTERSATEVSFGLLGGAAILWGSVKALFQSRLKLLIAYSTVAQLGYLFLQFPLAAAREGGFLAWSAG